MRIVRLVSLSLLLIAGCDAFFNVPTDVDGGTNPKVGLQRFESEADFRQYFAGQVTSANDVSSSNDNLNEVRGDGAVADGDFAAPPVATEDSAGGDGSATANPGYSTTTQQEEGVQEGDIVKNDGTFIYVLSSGTLRIVQANPGASLSELSSVTLEGYGQELYLVGDQVVVLTRPDFGYAIPIGIEGDTRIAADGYYEYRPKVNVSVIDVADRAQPAVKSTSTFEGELHSSRMIDNTLHLVLVNYPNFWGPMIAVRGGGGVVLEGETAEILPDFEIQVGEAEAVTGELVEPTDIYRPIDPDGYGMTTVLSLDVNNPAGFRSVGVVAYPGNIYASTEALYLTNSNFNFEAGSREATAISKFAFTAAGPELTAVGSVPGHVLNQYSMSEHQGFLRVATTVQDFDFTADVVPPSTNNVYVLAEEAGELKVVGRAENLAPGETIYSARFYGEKGYLVTFEQIDPLFTLDMADPTNPKAVGELKVPGFSTFILQLDSTHLLTVGQDVPLDQDFAFPQGVQLSIFDVSDFANPRLVAKELVGNVNAYSEALYNPKALTFLPGQNLVALPIQIYDYGFIEPLPVDNVDGTSGAGAGQSGGDGEVGDGSVVDGAPAPTDTFNGIYVYQVSAESGFQFLGRLGAVMDQSYYYSSFTRGVFMGDNVFGVTDLGVTGAPKTSIVESGPWRVAFPVAEIPPDVIVIDEDAPVVSDGGVAVETDGAVSVDGSAGVVVSPAGK